MCVCVDCAHAEHGVVPAIGVSDTDLMAWCMWADYRVLTKESNQLVAYLMLTG